MSAVAELSNELRLLGKVFTLKPDSDIVLKPLEAQYLATRIDTLRQLAESMEEELRIHRMGEIMRARGAELETFATELMQDVLVETRGNVIHASFRGKALPAGSPESSGSEA